MTIALPEPPAVLPYVTNLSASSIRLLRACPLKWKRRYIDGEYEPPNGKMLLGSAAGAAEATNYQQKIESRTDLPAAEVLDCFSDEFDERVEREDVAWGDDDRGELKDSGALALTAYHATVAPSVTPVAVERAFVLRFPGVEWTFNGYLDLEEDDGGVSDLKVKGRKLSQVDADTDTQPTDYLLARRTEGTPAPEFRFHTMVRTKKPYAEIVRTARTDAQLDARIHRIFAAAAEIQWRCESDTWDGAPAGAWWCGAKSCGYYHQCPFGGAR